MLTVGLIGAGRIGRVHASTISMHAHSKLVAVADVIEDNAQKLARDFGGQACSADAIYKDKSIDAFNKVAKAASLSTAPLPMRGPSLGRNSIKVAPGTSFEIGRASCRERV